ncbi:hypothetical protein C8R43DRAFT_1235672 [Mycena crocata]|nr:hypothetical protein C8R43DRAFT_1235672 [Mycena crocata]
MSIPRQVPSTPVSTQIASYSRKPTNSSPLAPSNSSPGSSPIAAVQARRRMQYKARIPSLSLPTCSRSTTRTRPDGFTAGPDVGDDAQTAFLRTRLKLRCLERASKARERAVKKKRFISSSEPGSDDVDAEMDSEEEEDPTFDELFTRIVHNTTRKLHHAYMYSYDREVGSDPIMEESWESELAAQAEPDEATAAVQDLEDDVTLQAYLEEQAAFADFADIPEDELFSWSDMDELENNTQWDRRGDVDMS